MVHNCWLSGYPSREYNIYTGIDVTVSIKMSASAEDASQYLNFLGRMDKCYKYQKKSSVCDISL